MTAKLEILKSYSDSLSGVKEKFATMGSALETLKSSVAQLETGSRQLTEGITTFNEGIAQLYEGAAALSSGASELTTAGESLNTGFSTLTQGAQTLKEGVAAFDEEGIQSLGDLAGSDLENLLTRIRALKEADSRYDNFAGIGENQTGSVKFIIRNDQVSHALSNLNMRFHRTVEVGAAGPEQLVTVRKTFHIPFICWSVSAVIGFNTSQAIVF